MRLTDKTTARLRLEHGETDRVWWDEDISGFGIRLRDGGSRTWIYRYRIGSKQRSVILGSATAVPLAVARKNASGLAARIRLGEDPALDRDNARLEADNTFGVLAQQYLETRKAEWRPVTCTEIKRHLTKYAKSLNRVPIAAISQRNIANLLNAIAKDAGDVTANRVRGSLCALFGWAMREGIRLPEGNVAALTNKREEKSRDRVLSDSELRTIWNACLDDDYGAILKLLTLTGQRAGEIAELRWDEVGDEQIRLPANRTKNGRPHTIPLAEPVKMILSRFNRDGRTCVFGRVDTGFNGWHNCKQALNARIAAAGKPLAEWKPHDLRRTAATRMAELGIQPHIVEAVLNHVSGHKGGVAGIYNRATYDKEKREALNLWAEHVMATVEGRAATVVPLKRA
ncbi:MAG: tyrosine-type recombinase/integrase [Xanthobacteraceae bacterium]